MPFGTICTYLNLHLQLHLGEIWRQHWFLGTLRVCVWSLRRLSDPCWLQSILGRISFLGFCRYHVLFLGFLIHFCPLERVSHNSSPRARCPPPSCAWPCSRVQLHVLQEGTQCWGLFLAQELQVDLLSVVQYNIQFSLFQPAGGDTFVTTAKQQDSSMIWTLCQPLHLSGFQPLPHQVLDGV